MFLRNVTAYIIIPLLTISIFWDKKWLTTTRKDLLILWGIIIGTYFFNATRKIIQYLPRNKKEIIVSKSALLFLALTIITPYLSNSPTLSTILDIGFSCLTSLLLLTCQYMIIWKLYCMKHQTYRYYLFSLNMIIVLSALLLYLTGIRSPFLSIFFTLSCTILLHRLTSRVIHQKARWR